MTEECNFFAFSVYYKDFVSLPTDTTSCRFVDILNSEAKCFILTKREPENSLSAKADMIAKVGNVVQLFPRYYSADFCHIPPSRFSQDLRCRISTRGLRFLFDKKILVVKMTSKVAYLENFYNYDYLF